MVTDPSMVLDFKKIMRIISPAMMTNYSTIITIINTKNNEFCPQLFCDRINALLNSNHTYEKNSISCGYVENLEENKSSHITDQIKIDVFEDRFSGVFLGKKIEKLMRVLTIL